MPTPTGAEPINERLFRLRTDLVRVRASIARGENNGASSNTGGVGLTEIAYEHLVERERKLAADISALEAASPDPPPAPASASYSPASPTERLAPGSTHPMPPLHTKQGNRPLPKDPRTSGKTGHKPDTP